MINSSIQDARSPIRRKKRKKERKRERGREGRKKRNKEIEREREGWKEKEKKGVRQKERLELYSLVIYPVWLISYAKALFQNCNNAVKSDYSEEWMRNSTQNL